MKTVISENETIIYPMLSENEVETEDLPKIIAGLEMALEII